MSLSMTKANGVTFYTVTSDPQSPCPPLCQILRGLCYSPACCSVSQQLKKLQTNSQTLLGALHIMIGLLNISFGVVLCTDDGCQAFPIWMGAVFLIFGIISILSEKFPSPCLVGINVFLNIAGVFFALVAIVLYGISIGDIYLWWMCEFDSYDYSDKPTSDYRVHKLQEKCWEGEAMVLRLTQGINGVLLILSVMEVCVDISCAVLGIKALRSRRTNLKGTDDLEVVKAVKHAA